VLAVIQLHVNGAPCGIAIDTKQNNILRRPMTFITVHITTLSKAVTRGQRHCAFCLGPWISGHLQTLVQVCHFFTGCNIRRMEVLVSLFVNRYLERFN